MCIIIVKAYDFLILYFDLVLYRLIVFISEEPPVIPGHYFADKGTFMYIRISSFLLFVKSFVSLDRRRLHFI